LQAVEGGNRSTSRENHTLVSQLCRGDKKFHLGEQGGEAGVGVGGRGEREGEKGGGVPRGEAAAERDGEADGAGDPADLLGQRAGFDHRSDLLQIWEQAAASATPNPGNSGGRLGFRRAGGGGSLRCRVESAGAAGGGAAGCGSVSFICTSAVMLPAAAGRRGTGTAVRLASASRRWRRHFPVPLGCVVGPYAAWNCLGWVGPTHQFHRY
jgi:hypothetical protein